MIWSKNGFVAKASLSKRFRTLEEFLSNRAPFFGKISAKVQFQPAEGNPGLAA